MSERIRWEPTADADDDSLIGYVDTLQPDVFMIWHANAGAGEWRLTSHLPGQNEYHLYRDGIDILKAEAERWLEEFVTSLGAVFGDALLELADGWQQFAAEGDAQDECARELREAITAPVGPGSVEDVVAASIEQQSAYRNELRHLPGCMTGNDPAPSAPGGTGEKE